MFASAFRTIRFGVDEAHGKGQAMQLNYLLDQGAFRVAKDGTFSVDGKKMKAAAKQLTKEIMTLQAVGNYAKAKEMLGKLGIIRPDTEDPGPAEGCSCRRGAAVCDGE